MTETCTPFEPQHMFIFQNSLCITLSIMNYFCLMVYKFLSLNEDLMHLVAQNLILSFYFPFLFIFVIFEVRRKTAGFPF